MKLILLVLILTGAACSATDRKPPALKRLDLLREDRSKIDFYLKRNFSDKISKTLLIYLQGSDCNSVAHDIFLQHAHAAFPSADLLLVEKRGITVDLPHSFDAERPDCPAEYVQRDSPQQRVQDIKQVTELILRTHDYQNVIALGGSEGALIAAMFAAETGTPNAVVSINSGGRYFLDDVLHNIKATTSIETVDAEINGFKGFVAHLLESEPFDLEMSNHGYLWWRSVLAIDQESVLKQIHAPVLLVQAGRDLSVSPDAVARMAENLHDKGKHNIDFRIYPDLDHGLVDSQGLYLAESLMSDVQRWLETALPKRLE